MPMISSFPFIIAVAAAVLAVVLFITGVACRSRTVYSYKVGNGTTTRYWRNTTLVTFGRRHFSWTIAGKSAQPIETHAPAQEMVVQRAQLFPRSP
ncbi:hypothetical protein DFH07DRAFT_954211 [Mycena maculata]|uniref:Uncharacterized protein n=1 Tax=Mycena maculata TaxID=230809 RepID=A0AAD7JQ86_9AGAR|nr:hypothetical protein DFH07DRAFT_954211 [Mycena maculata]